MKKQMPKLDIMKVISLFSISLLLTLSTVHSAVSAPVQSPLFLTQTSNPIVTLAMSMDQELFKKAYNDYSNLDGLTLTTADLTYRNDFDYYGYFDNKWCYTYNASGYYQPSVLANNHQCTGAWSGNFMNWATMSRIDIVRQVLYGGKRSTDTTTLTVLERAHLPRDVHAFVKVYSGNDLDKYTPYSLASTSASNSTQGLSLCNVSNDDLNASQQISASKTPLIKIAKGRWPQWSASEKFQCWDADSGTISPKQGAGQDLLVTHAARVSVCDKTKDYLSERCRAYPNGGSTIYKPAGILQKHGEAGRIKFALVSGSFKSSLQGGVLRKKAALFARNTIASQDEVSITTGIFNTSVQGIVSNINGMAIAGIEYQYAPLPGFSANETKYADCYDNAGNSPTITTVKDAQNAPGSTTYNNKRCRDWGNPISEIYLEALRYIAGEGSATTIFNDGDDSVSEIVKDAANNNVTIPGLPLTKATWDDPLSPDQWCATCSIIVLSTGGNSFDGDNLGSASNINGMSVSNWTNLVGQVEYENDGGFASKTFFAGTSTVGEHRCEAKAFPGGLSTLKGICPELPGFEGTYNIAGLAYYAKTNDLRPGSAYKNDQTVTTYAIDLAESLPSFKVGGITFLPACETGTYTVASDTFTTTSGCSLTDVRVETLFNKYSGSTQTAGSFLFFWEDAIWGNDYDLDAVQRIHWCIGSGCNDPNDAVSGTVGATTLQLTVSVPYARAGKALRFGYTLSGTASKDGVVAFNKWAVRAGGMDYTSPISLTSISGAYTKPTSLGSGWNTEWARTIRTETFAPGTSTPIMLKKPLYYAAKYGGFTDSEEIPNKKPDVAVEWDGDGDGKPDNYFNVSNPAQLEDSLNLVLSSIVGQEASASSAAVSSTRLSTDSYIYQARFNSAYWNGELAAFSFDSSGELGTTPALTTNTTMPKFMAGRTVYTAVDTTASFGNSVVDFSWANITPAQRAALASTTNTTLTTAEQTLAQNRLNWLKGDATNEGSLLRARTIKGVRNVLGDIVDTSPVYDGARDLRYDTLPGAMGSSYVTYLSNKKTKSPRIFVGANDGMIHAFDANTLAFKYSFVPPAIYSKLDEITRADYGTSANSHQYLMNGQITVGDAYINGSWRNILVAALGAGGRNVFALDITDGSIPRLLFNFIYDPAIGDNLISGSSNKIGYVMGKPFIVPMKNGRFAAVFGNGYESQTAKSSLFVVDLQSPTSTNTKIIETVSGQGLSTPELVTNTIGQVEYAYAGDLAGNLWKFNLSSDNMSAWTSSKLFEARDENNNIQPISAAPTLGRNSFEENRVVVYFGTGKYFETDDVNVGAAKNSLYAIVDMGLALDRSDLHEKTFTEIGSVRKLVNDKVDWSDKDGWYMDFDSTAYPGERITIKPLLLYDRIIVPTLTPSTVACSYGGTSWLMQVTAVGDKSFIDSPLESLGGKQEDYLVLGDLSFGVIDQDSGGGGGPTPECEPPSRQGTVIISASDGSIKNEKVCLEGVFGRINWRQLQ